MAKLLICCGPSPSGKTTFIRTWIAESPKTRALAYDKRNVEDLLARGFDVAYESNDPIVARVRDAFRGYRVTVREFTHDPAKYKRGQR